MSTIFRFAFRAWAAARLKDTALGADEAKRLDISLQPGVKFRASWSTASPASRWPAFVSGTGSTRESKGDRATTAWSTIADMLPGPFSFSVDATITHGGGRSSRQLSGAAGRSCRPHAAAGLAAKLRRGGFRPRPGMDTVTITLEPAVKITGQVLDPDRKAGRRRDGGAGLDRHGQFADWRHAFQRHDRRKGSLRDGAAGQRRSRIQPCRTRRQVWRVAHMGQRRPRPFRTKPGERLAVAQL